MKPLKPASLVLTALLAIGIVSVRAQSTAFTYQGRLRDNTIPAVGVFDLRFALYGAATGGTPVGSSVTAEDVAVTNGLFCVVLDFGVNAFTGAERWLETALRPGAETGSYTVLAPRRALTAAPYALYAPNAGTAATASSLPAVNLTGTVPLALLPGEVVTNNATGVTLSGNFSGGFAGTVTGTLSGDGSGLTNIKASSIVIEGGTIPLPSGITLVSLLPNDANLVASGYRLMMTVPAPAWVTSATSEAPSPRFGHSAVWSGQGLFVWGGRLVSGSSYLNSGGCYYPDSDQWQAISTVDAPEGRWGHTAVWTGTEMLVWGGNVAAGRLNTGGRYQPDRQLWRSLSASGAPSARTEHVAVWTGSQMLVWGGQSASGLLNDGALYNPAQDLWSAVSSVNAPFARVGATAVWADDRVLLWGGEGAGGVLNSGGALVDGSWAAMTSLNAPAGRRGHSAIWSGSKVIIWGGQSGGVPYGDGAAYDPPNDSWETLPSTGAPAARFNHAAVWTGQEMLIVGGSNGTTEFSSGAAYNPSTGVWRTLSNSGSPRARTEATASWTGTEVLVFGGRAQGLAIGSLQRLVPQPAWYFYRKL